MALGTAGAAMAAAPGAKKVLLVKTQRHADVGSLVATRVNSYVETVAAMESRLDVVMPEGLADAAPAAPVAVVTDGTLLRADEALEKAKDQVRQKKFMDATKTFKQAMSLYEKKLDLLENFDKYVDAQLGRALAFFLAGYDDNGEDELAKVLTFRPGLALDKRAVPPAAAQALERLKVLWGSSATEEVEVQANAPDARVYVDGILVGTAPATGRDLARGKHVVRVVAPGYEPWADQVDAGRTKVVKAKLKAVKGGAAVVAAVDAATPEALAEAARTGGYGGRFDSAAAALCAKHGLDGIVLTYIAPRPEEYVLAAFWFDAGKKQLVEVAPASIDLDLATMQVGVLELVERVVGTATGGYDAAAVVTGKPAVYELPAKAGPPDAVAVVEKPP
ncbi:MAG: PEGA domain-containing protein, partial [Myxococcales bacterium]|nr:PEGA domain-containing protein [Myxococcales bacterium]